MVLYVGNGDNDVRVGEVYFHANLAGELFVCLSNWPVTEATSQWKKVHVKEEFIIVPSALLLQAVIYTPAKVGQISTILVPQ